MGSLTRKRYYSRYLHTFRALHRIASRPDDSEDCAQLEEGNTAVYTRDNAVKCINYHLARVAKLVYHRSLSRLLSTYRQDEDEDEDEAAR
jgi:hypothetical protein